jgi:tetratricopeptide (TPR) repeat protein
MKRIAGHEKEDAKGLIADALEKFKAGNLEEAEALLLRAMEIEPGNASAWQDLDLVAMRLAFSRPLTSRDMHRRAVTYFRRALEIDPNLAVSLKYEASSLNALGLYKEGLKAIERAIELSPPDSEMYVFEGDILANLCEHDLAHEAYCKAYRINPKDPVAIMAKGRHLGYRVSKAMDESQGKGSNLIKDVAFMLYRENEPLVAEHMLLALMTSANRSYARDAAFVLGLLVMKDAASEEPVLSIALKAQFPFFEETKTVEKKRTMELVLAKSCFERSVKEDPTFVEGLLELARIHSFIGSLTSNWMGGIDQAIPLYTRVLELDPRHKDSLYELGMIYHEKGSDDQAVPCLERALEVDPSFAKAKDLLESIKNGPPPSQEGG